MLPGSGDPQPECLMWFCLCFSCARDTGFWWRFARGITCTDCYDTRCQRSPWRVPLPRPTSQIAFCVRLVAVFVVGETNHRPLSPLNWRLIPRITSLKGMLSVIPKELRPYLAARIPLPESSFQAAAIKNCTLFRTSVTTHPPPSLIHCPHDQTTPSNIKVKLKVAGGFRAMGGSRAFCIIRSVRETSKCQGTNPFQALRAAFAGGE
jgi:hypothetical protein